MRAISFDVTVPRYLAARALGRVTDSVLFGRLSGVSLISTEVPPLPTGDWVRLAVRSAGICGTDIGTVSFSASPALEPFGSFPAVLGHEIVAEVVETGDGVRGFAVGQRVVVDPMISCLARGIPAVEECPSCSSGRHCTCERAGESGPLTVDGVPLAPGLTIGYHSSLPGGWAEEMICHQSQLFPVPDEMDDRTAVLIEPLAVGMHAVLNSEVEGRDPVLVIGSGPIALGTIWALRASGYSGKIVAQIKREHEAKIALSLGASEVVNPGDAARDALVATGSSAYMPIVGDEVYAGGGFPVIFDCVGSRTSLWQSMRYASPRGRIVLLGCAAQMKGLDLTFVWARELDIRGFVGYGIETFRGERRHTFEVTRDLLLETGAPVSQMVTHVFPLSEFRDALRTAARRRATGSVKVLLDPRAG